MGHFSMEIFCAAGSLLSGNQQTGYQWQRKTNAAYANIAGATASTYTPVTADGNNIRCVVNFGGQSVTTTPCLYLGQVATKCLIPNATTPTNKQLMSVSPHLARDDITSLQIVIPNWFWDRQSSKLEVGTGGTLTCTASIEYPAGTFTQLKFGGNVSGVAADASFLTSDAGAVAIPSGAWFFVRIFAIGSAGIPFTQGFTVGSPAVTAAPSDVNNGQRMTYGNALTDQTMGGTVVNTDVTVTRPCFGPFAIIAATRKEAAFLMGDSIDFGSGDTHDASGDLGVLSRSIGPAMGYINAGAHGDTALGAKTAYAKRGYGIKFCSSLICELGRNDILAGNTASTLEGNLATLYAMANGIPVFQTTITPKSTSTDLWATIANQTPDTNNAQEALFNSWARGTPSPLAGFFDVGDVLANTRDADIIKVTGAANGYTPDGLHFNQAGNLLVKNSGVVNTAVLSRAA